MPAELSEKTLTQLVEDKAGCFEMAMQGFIRIYEEGEEKCRCKDCVLVEEMEKYDERRMR